MQRLLYGFYCCDNGSVVTNSTPQKYVTIVNELINVVIINRNVTILTSVYFVWGNINQFNSHQHTQVVTYNWVDSDSRKTLLLKQ